MDDEHARRNLLVASALVLLSVWLGSPVGALAKAVLTAEGAEPLSAFRVWFAVVLLLLYLGHRFQCSHFGTTGLREWRNSVDSRRDGRVLRLLSRALSKTAQAGANSPLIDPPRGSAAWLKAQEGAQSAALGVPVRLSPIARTFGLKEWDSGKPWRGRLSVELMCDGSAASAGTHRAEAAFSIDSLFVRRLVGAQARWDALTTTGALTDYVVPVVMALCACGVAAYHTAAAW